MDTDGTVDIQDWVYDAMEGWGTPAGLEKAKLVPQYDPDNPEVLGLMATVAEALLERAQSNAELRLGPNVGKTYRGAFWLDIDTRPYMRILYLGAEHEESLGNRKEAIRILERMLKLNPNDNQGIRYELIGKLLAERMLPKTRKLLKTYENDASA